MYVDHRTGTDPRPSRAGIAGTSFDSSQNCSGITVSRAPARALRALSRRFRGWIALPAPLRVYRPPRASGGAAEGLERIEGARKTPLRSRNVRAKAP